MKISIFYASVIDLSNNYSLKNKPITKESAEKYLIADKH